MSITIYVNDVKGWINLQEKYVAFSNGWVIDFAQDKATPEQVWFIHCESGETQEFYTLEEALIQAEKTLHPNPTTTSDIRR